jgi:hypothetical protein
MKIFRTLTILLCIMAAKTAYTQDTLYMHNKEIILAKILEINPKEVVYKKTSYLDGPTFRSYKTDIDSIHFQNGMREILAAGEETNPKSKTEVAELRKESVPFVQKPFKSVFPGQSFREGEIDALGYYRGYKGIGTASYLSGLFFFYYGFPVPLVGSLTPPHNMYKFVPDMERYQKDIEYARGFDKKARSMKAGKAWANYGYGAATLVGIGVAIVVIAMSAYSQ